MSPDRIFKRPEEVGVNQLVDSSARTAFNHWLNYWSDIKDHLPYLYGESHGLVVELGTRGGVSTAALLAGVEDHGGLLISVDINPMCAETFKGHKQWIFKNKDSSHPLAPDEIFDYEPSLIDLLFIDTNHTYLQLKTELDVWSVYVKPGGKIILHDVLAFPEMGLAADEFASSHSKNYRVRSLSNGLGIIEI